MKHMSVFCAMLILLFISTCDGGEAVKETPTADGVLYFSIESDPSGAEVYYRVVSTVVEVKSTNRFFLGRTPYRETRTLQIPGLTRDNALHVTVVINIFKNGYLESEERFNGLSLLSSMGISLKTHLVPGT